MPLPKQVPKLQRICFKIIDENLETMEIHLQRLPYPMRNDLYNYLQCTSNNQQRRLHPDIFINKNTKQIHSLKSFTRPQNEVIEKISEVCRKLTALDLSNCGNISAECSTILFRNLPNLKTLKLRKNSWLINDILIEIASSCSKLNYLDIFDCNNISDDGISSLQLIKIEYLNINDTSVSPEGCLVVLKTIPTLKEFQYRKFKTAFPLLVKEFTSNLRTFALEKASMVLSNGNDVKMARNMFPNLCTMFINDITFTDEFVTMLKNLTQLLLIDCRNIDLGLISTHCTRLQHFGTYCCSVSDEWTNVVGTSFNYLRNLELLNTDISEVFLANLLTKCQKLEELRINRCDSFTDKLVTDAIESGALKNLASLKLTVCDSVTKSSLYLLMRCKNPLKVLYVHKCRNIAPSHWLELDNFIMGHNLDVEFYL